MVDLCYLMSRLSTIVQNFRTMRWLSRVVVAAAWRSSSASTAGALPKAEGLSYYPMLLNSASAPGIGFPGRHKGRPTNPSQPERPYVKFGPVWSPEPSDNLTSGRAGTRGRLAASPQAPLSNLGWFGARSPPKI